MNATEQELQELGQAWANAELNQDVDYLDALLTPDFVGIGPKGFMLTKEQWLGRYRAGSFKYNSLAWEDNRIRVYGDSALVIGIQAQEGSFQGQPSNGRFRGTQVFVRQDGRWLLAEMQLSLLDPMAEQPRPQPPTEVNAGGN